MGIILNLLSFVIIELIVNPTNALIMHNFAALPQYENLISSLWESDELYNHEEVHFEVSADMPSFLLPLCTRTRSHFYSLLFVFMCGRRTWIIVIGVIPFAFTPKNLMHLFMKRDHVHNYDKGINVVLIYFWITFEQKHLQIGKMQKKYILFCYRIRSAKIDTKYKMRYSFCLRRFYALVQNNKLASTKNYVWYIMFLLSKATLPTRF